MLRKRLLSRYKMGFRVFLNIIIGVQRAGVRRGIMVAGIHRTEIAVTAHDMLAEENIGVAQSDFSRTGEGREQADGRCRPLQNDIVVRRKGGAQADKGAALEPDGAAAPRGIAGAAYVIHFHPGVFGIHGRAAPLGSGADVYGVQRIARKGDVFHGGAAAPDAEARAVGKIIFQTVVICIIIAEPDDVACKIHVLEQRRGDVEERNAAAAVEFAGPTGGS